MIKVGIVGGTGYTGIELLRILALHPEVAVTVVTSRVDAGKNLNDIYPNLRDLYHLKFTVPTFDSLKKCDVVFFATPNGIAMTMAEQLLQHHIKIIDLSADFRLKEVAVWEKWYGMDHACPDLIKDSVYGLPEMNREQIKTASLIACAGCYPTAVQLGLMPLMEAGLIELNTIIADVKSGVSGGGRRGTVPMIMSEIGESVKAYGVEGHRHLPEIKQGLASMASGKNKVSADEIGLTFTPHLIPMIRGIYATVYTKTTANLVDIHALYRTRYQHEAFVKVLNLGVEPNTRNVRGSNFCQIGLFKPQGKDTLVILSVIDNLVKGAAGQAVQILNINHGFSESLGLETVALYP
ncbi:MAG: N-acetyl-gamma-glutamyl-phosphate reductase [Methylococcales bacterium]|nr:N-acetyl-gamma-glutamyl-phosphate reductase [Methylococcales bacterium]